MDKPRVKPLVWGFHPYGTMAADNVGHCYIIDARAHRPYFIKWPQGFPPNVETLEAAKAVAQADYESRILATLEPAPVSLQDHARALLDAESDGEVWRTYVNAMMPILREDMSADSWHTVDEIRGAMIAALRALAGDEGER